MTSDALIQLIMGLAGGFALFIFGLMNLTDGLKSASSGAFQNLIASATHKPARGLALGTFLGTVAHSSATTVMVVGFLNAGLISLAAAIPIIAGANIGTTFAMQLITLRLGDYGLIPVAIGLGLMLAVPRKPWKQTGQALIGFGLIFIGMSLMSGAVVPYREGLSRWLMVSYGGPVTDGLVRFFIGLGFTALVQSSGATIGLLFAFSSVGVFGELSQVYPILLGAHVGTCVTALLGSLGGNAEARRGALSHLVFNLIGVGVGVAAAPALLAALPRVSGSLTHQIAHAHSAVMILTAVVVFPLSPVLARMIRAATFWMKEVIEPTYLDPGLLTRPDQAISAVIRELGRVGRMLRLLRMVQTRLLVGLDANLVATIKQNEKAVDRVKATMNAYLYQLTLQPLSHRQMILIQHVNMCMTYLERIGDHFVNLQGHIITYHKRTELIDNFEARRVVETLYESVEPVLESVIEAFDPETDSFADQSLRIMACRHTYRQYSESNKALALRRITEGTLSPVAGFMLSEFFNEMDRIVRHCKKIAQILDAPEFRRETDTVEVAVLRPEKES